MEVTESPKAVEALEANDAAESGEEYESALSLADEPHVESSEEMAGVIESESVEAESVEAESGRSRVGRSRVGRSRVGRSRVGRSRVGRQPVKFTYQPIKLLDPVVPPSWIEAHPLPNHDECESLNDDEYEIFDLLYQSAKSTSKINEAMTPPS